MTKLKTRFGIQLCVTIYGLAGGEKITPIRIRQARSDLQAGLVVHADVGSKGMREVVDQYVDAT